MDWGGISHHRLSNTVIETFSGQEIDLMDPDISKVNIEDIAHNLALENRYNGGTKFPVSVAQHSVLVSMIVDKRFSKQGLLHDAHEYIYKDLTRPLKVAITQIDASGYALYEHLCRSFDALLFGKYGVTVTEESCVAVKKADNLACRIEARAAMHSRGTNWNWNGTEDAAKYADLQYLSWIEAESDFLIRYQELWHPQNQASLNAQALDESTPCREITQRT